MEVSTDPIESMQEALQNAIANGPQRAAAADCMADDEAVDARRQAEVEKRLGRLFHRRRRYRACSLENFICKEPGQREAIAALTAYGRELGERLQNGNGLVLFGPAGTGKDHLLAAMMTLAVVAGQSVRWVNGMDVFGAFRDRMDDQRGTERDLLEEHIAPTVLAMSDPLPPFGSLTEFQASTLFRIVDGRYAAWKPTWVTVNAAGFEESAGRMGMQVTDRLTDGALVVPCHWPSYRRPRE